MQDLDTLSGLVLDHIAIAVKNIESSQKIFSDLGAVFSPHHEVVATEKVKTAFAAIDVNAHLELLEPMDDSSAIAKFIAKNGEGLHHICFKVQDIATKCAELKQKGYHLIYENPRPGAKNCLVNFIHPRSTGGVLVELSEVR